MFLSVTSLQEALGAQLHVCPFLFSPVSVEAGASFPVPWGGNYTYIAFWIQMPGHMMLVAADCGAGGSGRDGPSLLIGERGLHCLPLAICSLLVFCFSLPCPLCTHSLYFRTQGVTPLFWSTVFLYGNIGGLIMFSFYTQTSGFSASQSQPKF